MLRSFSRSVHAVFQIVSPRVLAVPMHWAGRSVLCAGDHCPACVLRLPRLMHYCGAVVQERLCTLEMCSSLADVINGVWGAVGQSSPCGLKFEVARTGVREQWTVVQSAPRDVQQPVSEWAVVRDVANAFRVPGPVEGETFNAWYQRVSPAQALVLAKTQLFV